MKHITAMKVALVGMLGIAWTSLAAEPIGLSVGNFRPLEAETSKYLAPVQRQSLDDGKTALTDEDRKFLDAEDLGAIRRNEVREKIWERRRAIYEMEAFNDQREAEIEHLRQSMLGEPEMRPLFDGGKKLAAKLSQYGTFRILERNDMAELLNEAGGESADLASAVFSAARKAGAYMVYVDVGDLHRNTSQGNVGGVAFKDTKFVRDFILKLQDVQDGTIALSRTFTVTKTQTVTSVGGTVTETIHSEMLDEAINQIAEAIYQNFMAKITFALKVAPNNPDLDPGMIALEIYDETGADLLETVTDGSVVELTKGKYVLKCQDPYSYLFMDNKDQKGPVAYTASKTESQLFQSAMQEVEFAFADPDGAFPEVTLTPVGGEGEEISVYPGVNTIRKGVYEMKARLDGYRDLTRQQPITAMTRKVQIQMMKEPAGAPMGN